MARVVMLEGLAATAPAAPSTCAARRWHGDLVVGRPPLAVGLRAWAKQTGPRQRIEKRATARPAGQLHSTSASACMGGAAASTHGRGSVGRRCDGYRRPPVLAAKTTGAEGGWSEEGPGREGSGGGMEEDEPWLGAVVYERGMGRRGWGSGGGSSGGRGRSNAVEVQWRTTLERLGLSDLSSEGSRAAAASALAVVMPATVGGAEYVRESGGGGGGERATEEEGTVVSIWAEVVPSGRGEVVLEGEVRTYFGVNCTRCLGVVTHSVEAPFSLLLTTTPVLEPTARNLGVVLGDDDLWASEDEENEGEGVLDLDLDDKVYFPPDMKSVDLSKYFHDTVHLELPLKVRCRADCKGMCLGCGANLNQKRCSCDDDDDNDGDQGGDGGSGGRGSRRRGKGPVVDGLEGGRRKGSLADQLRQQLRDRGISS